MRKSVIFAAIAAGLLAFAVPAVAATVSQETALAAAEGFIRPGGFGARLLPDRSVASATAWGNLWIVALEPSGHIILAGSDKCEPITFFSSQDFVEPEVGSPFAAKLTSDSAWVAEKDADESAEVNPKWAKLTAPAAKKRQLLAAAPSSAGSVVGPLMNVGWGQGAPFNDLSPLSSLCGCMATAAGQEHRYWRWPYRYEKSRQGAHGLRNSLNEYSEHVMRPDGRVPFNYDKVVAYAPNPASTPRATDKEATYQTAFLSLWMQSLTGMSYKPGASGGTQKLCNFAEQYWFEAGPVMSYWRDGYTNLWNAIKADLDFGSPIQVNSPGHQMVVDGYAIENEGTDSEVDYVNINYGWGYPEGWVNLLTAVTESTSGGRLADFQIGYRPQKIVQFEPVPKVSTNNVTLTWHLPPCYTNRTTGFTIEVAKAGGATTSDTIATHGETTTYTANGLDNGGSYTFTVTPVMSDGSEARANSATTTIGTPKAAPEITGVASIACGIDLVQQGFYIECGRGITNKIAVACSTSVTNISAYSSHLTVLPDAKVAAIDSGNGNWTINVDATAMASDWDGDMLILTLVAANADGTEAYKNLMLRFNSMRQELGGTYEIIETTADNAVWFCGTTTLDAKGQNVTFGAGAFCGTGTITLTDSVGNGSFTFQGLGNFTGTLKWAPSVAVNLPADMSNFAGTLYFNSPAGNYTLSTDLPSTAKIFITGNTQLTPGNVTIDAAVAGGGIINIAGVNATFNNLKDFTGSVSLGTFDSAGTLTLRAGDEKNVEIWNGTLYLTLDKAQVAYGYTTSQIKELESFLGAKLVFQDEDGNALKTWTSSLAEYTIESNANTWFPDMNGTGSFWDADRWSQGLPNAGDYVIFNDNFGDSEMTLNLSSDFNLGYVKVVGTKFNIMAADGTATLSVDTLENEVQTKIKTDKFLPAIVIPQAKLFVASGITLDCEIDYSIANNIRDPYDLEGLYWESCWHGTVVFTDYTDSTKEGLDLTFWGNDNSTVRLNGFTGRLTANKIIPYTVELVDSGTSPALHWNTGTSGATSIFEVLTGDGIFKTSGGTAEKVLLKDVSGFTGQFQLAAKTVAIADEMPTVNTGDNGKLHVCKDATIASGSIWNIGGGVYFGSGCNLDIYGQLWSLSAAMTTYGDGAVVTLEDGAVIRAAVAMAGEHAPTLNFKAGTYQFEGNATETKTVNFCAAAGKYTTLDANGKTATLGANFFSGSGDVYLKTSASGGSFVIQGIPAAYTGTIYVDNSIGLTISGDLSQMGGKINISDITLSRDSSNIGKIDVCSGATLQVVLTDREAMGSFTPSGVTLLGGTIEYVDQRGTIITTSTESVNYTKPDDYSVPAPEPTAVWVSGQFADEAELHGGYTISTTLAGSINSAGNIVIGDGAYLGAQISLPDNTYTKASVLVKFRASAGGAPAANSVIAGVFDTSEYPIGAICKTAGGTAFEGYYQAKNGTALTTGYNLSSPTISEGEGYMLFSFQSDPTSIQPATGTALYLGDSIANLTGGAYAGLQWRGYAISKLAIGGPAVATPSPWKGLEIESVALFAGEWFSPSDVEFYEFPKAEEPEYEGPDPVAVWVAGEFDDDRSAHGGLEISLNGNTTNALGQIVIGDSSSATLGATIAIPEGFDNATMLVKYEIPSGGAPAANSVPASVFVTKEMGALAGNASSSLGGYWLNGSTVTTGYAFSSPAPSIPLEGYLLISAPANSNKNQGNHFTAVYVGETIANLSGGEAGSGSSGLRFTGPNNRVTSVGIGGPTVAGAKPWTGMVIKSVAIFDEWVTPTDLATYRFPGQGAVLPEDSDLYAIEPVAKWVNDFKTTEKNGCTLSVSGTTAAKDDSFGGTLTIGDASAVIDTTAAATSNMTVLIKYRAASNVTNAPVVAFGAPATHGLDVGVYTKLDKTLAVYRNFSTDNSKPYNLSVDPVLSATGGYVLCARDNGRQCMAYVGDSLDAMTGGAVSDDNIKFSNLPLKSLGIGGNSSFPANANDMVPFTGFEIEKIVIFSGYYTPDQIRYVPNPEDGVTLSIADGATWNFAAGTTRTYTNIGTISTSGTIAITNASELTEGTYPLATWTTPQQYTTQCAGYGKVGTLVTDGLAEGLSARLIYGARGIYLRVDDTAKQAARKPLVVWCYGDSITEGYNAQATGANYRILLYQKLEMLGYNVRSTGVYGLSNGYNSVDPSGTPLTDQYRWHSAKHGATAGPSTLCHRSNLSENVDTLAIQAGTPDVALLLIGVNDLPEFSTVEPVFKAWTNVVNRLVNNLPNTKIIVSTILNSDGSRVALDSQIADINTNYIKRIMADQPEEWQSHVFLADLNDCVKSGDPGIIYNDHLHPDWWGYDQMADGYLAAIRECYPDPDATDFPSQNPIPAAPTVEQLGAANKPELADYRAGFTKLCNIRVEKGQDVNNVLYDDVNGNAASENLEKVGYFVEFVRADNHAHKWVWVDMDAFGDADLASVGLPQRNYQQAVTRMHVCSNHGAIDNVAADDNSVTGWIEFSPYNYDRPNNNTEAPDNYVATGKHPFDWNDTLSESGSYGCMQVFRVMNPSSKVLYERPQLMFAFNNFQSQNSNPADFGIGNFAQHFNCNNSYHTEDWTGVGGTLAKMAPDQYSVKTIEIWTKEKATNTDYPTPYSWIDMYFPELVSGWTSTEYNDFATNKNHGSVKNGYAPWESYVLGLDPTNETSKFLATIRMDGATPIVGYSPTNEVLKASGAIEYVLQGKPTLTNDWADCLSFDELGDTNRFFRVKVTW